MHIVGFDTFCFFLLSFVLCQSTDVRNHRNWKYLPSKNCGHGAVQDRIVGGSEAALGQFPWMAQLGYELKKSTISYLCAGSLINRWYVLTAKHCFDEQMANTARVVRLGENFLNKNIDCEYDVCAPPVQDIKMSKIISYKTTKDIPLNYADIALVKLAKPARYNDFVSPVCLPRGNIITHVQKHLALNSVVELAGWGVLDSEDEKIPERLMRIYLPVAKLDRCKNFFSMNKIDHSQICIGVGNGKDTCVGDSGGPVMKAIADNSPPKQYIFGIVSYGTKWCGLNSALYTNVTHYLDWILDHIEPIRGLEIVLETKGTGPQTLDLIKNQPVGVQLRSIGVGTRSDEQEDAVPTCSISAKVVDDETAFRRRSLVPMSSMEEENLRERLRLAHLRLTSENVNREQKYTKDGFRRLLQSKDLLEQLFKLFDQERTQSLPQENWIEFLKQRLTNEKQIDFAEQLESVAFCLCGDEPIKAHQFYQIFNAKGIGDKLFRLLDEDNTGTVSSEQIMEFLASITNSRPRTGIDQANLDRLEQLFRQTVGNEKEIRRDDFQKIVISKNPFFTERVFQIFDKDNSGSISLQEFLDAMHQFAGQSPDDKIRFLFKVYDIDGDGLIQHKELQHVMRACMEENGMQFSEEQIEDLTVAMFEDADTNNRGAITYEALKSQLEKHGGLLENLSISIDRWLVPPPAKTPKSKTFFRKILSYRPYYFTMQYFRNNLVYLIFLFGFVLVNLALFVSRSVQYRKSNWFVIFARACGQCLNFDCAFILMLMLRRCITFLRTRGYGSILPLDQHIYFHKLTGWLIFGFSFWHSLMHAFNFTLVVVNSPELNQKNFTVSEWLFTTKPGLFGLIGGWANPTGVALFVILLVMFLCSQSFVRRGGCFEVFYWTHLMYIPFWILLMLHGPNFWKWFLIPGLAYLIERISRIDTMSSKGKTYISSGLLLPSKVTHLVIKRPPQFDFHPGDYLFVNIPAVATYEWHPFTISSCPEQEDYMWLHIRGVGQWTNRLYEYFEQEQEKLHNGEIIQQHATPGAENSNQNTLTQIKATITRTLSRREKNSNGNKDDGVQLVGFYNESIENAAPIEGAAINNNSSDQFNRPRRMSPEHRLQRLIFTKRAPLEKSLSLPDVQNSAKKKERMLALREYMRSESEKSFDQCQMRRARLKSFGLAYLSPQNKSLAQSFRYMRNKPTIIAFKTPSLEQCDKQDSSSSMTNALGGRMTSFSCSSPERRAEEGQAFQLRDLSAADPKLKHINYPIGKPLEVSYIGSCLRGASSEEDLAKTIKVKYSDRMGTEIYLDGPYGAPSSHIFRAQHAVLIATGIGVTPFASILQSIMHRYWKARHTCPNCKFSWACEIPASIMNLRKVDFFWINRNQRSFEWFVNLLSQLEIEQAELGSAMERFLEMHMYITSALQKTDMKAVGLQLALDLLHEKEKRDLITGLKTRTNAGRPNWDKVFKQISDQKKGKVTVFYCGPPQLGRILRVKCDQHGFIFRKESF